MSVPNRKPMEMGTVRRIFCCCCYTDFHFNVLFIQIISNCFYPFDIEDLISSPKIHWSSFTYINLCIRRPKTFGTFMMGKCFINKSFKHFLEIHVRSGQFLNIQRKFINFSTFLPTSLAHWLKLCRSFHRIYESITLTSIDLLKSLILLTFCTQKIEYCHSFVRFRTLQWVGAYSKHPWTTLTTSFMSIAERTLFTISPLMMLRFINFHFS